jgi:uncharacterized protein
MLDLRPNCEYCDADIAADSPDAFICTFECTFCRTCNEGVLAHTCPNCGGNLERRPVRSAALLLKYPARKERTPLKPRP